MQKTFIVAALFGFICILNQAGNSMYILDYTDGAVPPSRHIHISYPAEKSNEFRDLETANNRISDQLDLFEGLAGAYNIRTAHYQNNPDIQIVFTFWKIDDTPIHELATNLFISKVIQENPNKVDFKKKNI